MNENLIIKKSKSKLIKIPILPVDHDIRQVHDRGMRISKNPSYKEEKMSQRQQFSVLVKGITYKGGLTVDSRIPLHTEKDTRDDTRTGI